MGYFWVLPLPSFWLKPGLKQGTILENATNQGKYRRTRKFTQTRDENRYFHLGRVLLRSARSFLDETAFVSINEPTTAVTPDP